MGIPSKKVLDKMDELVQKAKVAPADKRNGYLIAIQSLIDLIINEPADEVAQVVKQVVPYNPIQQQSPSVSLPQEKPVRMEDANGDSLFDF